MCQLFIKLIDTCKGIFEKKNFREIYQLELLKKF